MSGPGAYLFGCQGPDLLPQEAAFFADAQPWGFILFARNFETPDQVRRLTAALRNSVGRDAPIFVDQEGGRVQRMWAPHVRTWYPPLDQVTRAGSDAARSMYLRYALIGAEFAAMGVDGNCSPCADVAREMTHPFLKNRCYGSTPEAVTEIARAVATGLLSAGVLPVLKHIPGHGAATLDSHKELPIVDLPINALMETDFAPFRALADLPLGMTAHIVYSEFDDRPATTSAEMIRVIRETVGFAGLLMTDDLGMEALGGSPADRAAASLAAGCDLILHCNGTLEEMATVAEVSGAMPPEAVQRGENALALRGTLRSIDEAAMEAELADLLKGQVYVSG